MPSRRGRTFSSTAGRQPDVYPVSDRFLRRITESHDIAVEVDLFTTSGQVIPLDVTGGSVTIDRGQDIRRTCSVSSADVSLIPRTPSDQLATYGARLRIAVGVEYGDGSRETVPQGVFRLDSIDGDPVMGPVTLQGKAIECIIQDDLFTVPYRAVGTVVTAVTGLIQRSLPAAEIVSRITDVGIGATTWDVQGDPWAAVQEVAATAGAVVYTDGDGVFVIAALPDLLTAVPVWEVSAGEGGVLVSANRGMSADGVYNGVYASGEDAGSDAPPVSALVVDTDTGSPTYWGGPFGRRPQFYSSSTLTSIGACTAAATLKLAAAKAPNATGDLSSLPNPALEPGDVLRVTYADGIRELHQVANLTVPLDTGGDFPIGTIAAKEDA